MYAVDSSTRNWSVGPPDFSRRSQEERDKGDIPVYYGWDTFWVEVKTATNRMGRHNRKNTSKPARFVKDDPNGIGYVSKLLPTHLFQLVCEPL